MESTRKQCAVIVCCMVLLNKGVCGTSFPGIHEVLDLEVPNMWSLPSLISWKPYRDSLETRIQKEIISDPWNRTMDLKELVTTIIESLERSGIAEEAVQRIKDVIFRSDPLIYSTLRRGLPPLEYSIEDVVIQETCRVFGVDPGDVFGDIESMYDGIFRQLS